MFYADHPRIRAEARAEARARQRQPDAPKPPQPANASGQPYYRPEKISPDAASYYARHHERDHHFPHIWQQVCPLCAALQSAAELARACERKRLANSEPCPDVNRLRALAAGEEHAPR
jgi:hypothetical protein